MSTATEQLLRQRLQGALSPTELVIVDDSLLHAGHAGAGGGGHFRVRIVSSAFRHQGIPARHRQVYQAAGDLMGSAIHALSIEALAPEDV